MTDQTSTLVILNGELPDETLLKRLWNESKVIVCADGAASQLVKHRLVPDVIIGDLDSIGDQNLKHFSKCKIIRDSDQETTDSEKALNYCLEQNLVNIKMTGALGKRLDHSLYNIELLDKFSNRGLNITCYTRREKLKLIEKTTTLTDPPGTIISLTPVFGPAKGVNLEGFEFQLRQENLEFGQYSSMSNRIVSPHPTITINQGKLLLISSHF